MSGHLGRLLLIRRDANRRQQVPYPVRVAVTHACPRLPPG
jgi:hypothetical protein